MTPLRGAESGYRTYETPVVILHTGYDLPEQQKKEKAERNIRLLEQELKQLGWAGMEMPGRKTAAQRQGQPEQMRTLVGAGRFRIFCISSARAIT